MPQTYLFNETKFSRDKKAYDNGKAYKWLQQGPQRKKTFPNSDFPLINLDRLESDSSSVFSALHVPIGLRQEEMMDTSKRRKNEGDSSLQGLSRSHFPLKDKRLRSQRSQQRSTLAVNAGKRSQQYHSVITVTGRRCKLCLYTSRPTKSSRGRPRKSKSK